MGNIFRKKTKIVPIVLIKGSADYTDDCSICLKSFNKNNYEMPCGHNFHQECILIWFDKKINCPLCRQSFQWSLQSNMDSKSSYYNGIIKN